MNKDIFLYELERMLYDIPKEERDEAMDYYRSYFEDAGVENEAVVIEELESPQKIAESIKEGLNSTGDMASFLKNPPLVREFRQRSEGSREEKSHTSESEGVNYKRYDQYDDKSKKNTQGGMDKSAKLILLIIAAVFTIPIWGTIVSGVIGIVGAAIAVVVVLAVFSVGGVIGGIVCTILAITRLCMFSVVKGLSMLAIGMFLIVGSGISIVLLLLVCGRFLPWAVRQIAQLFHRLLTWGRSLA